MEKVSSTENPQLARTSAEAVEQLSSIFEAYNQTTDRLHSSYQQLKEEVVRLRQELKQKNEQLERKSRLAALGEMTAGIAHEIRNPLGAMQLYTSLLESELKDRQVRSQWVHKITKGVCTLDTIVTDMLAFTQDQACEKTEVNFGALMTEVMDYARPQIKSEKIKIDLTNVAADLVVNLDINMMRRVFLNLLLNAISAVGDQGRITIEAAQCRNNPHFNVRICVSDTGCGIQAETMNKIFDPFFTTKDSGTGLGLAIVHRLVECHGGIVTAANNEGPGATFTILLP